MTRSGVYRMISLYSSQISHPLLALLDPNKVVSKLLGIPDAKSYGYHIYIRQRLDFTPSHFALVYFNSRAIKYLFVHFLST